MNFSSFRTLIIAIGLCLTTSVQASQAMTGFNDLLDEAGMTFDQPLDYAPIEIQPSQLFPYEYALKRNNNNMEVRYSIRPLARIEIDYEDPHNAAPEPNHIFTMMFTALIGQLSSGGSTPHREFRVEEARQKFNADWAALSVFDVEQSYAGQYQQAFLLAMHKNNLSDAYMVILFNDYNEIKPQLDTVMRSLRFK